MSFSFSHSLRRLPYSCLLHAMANHLVLCRENWYHLHLIALSKVETKSGPSTEAAGSNALFMQPYSLFPRKPMAKAWKTKKQATLNFEKEAKKKEIKEEVRLEQHAFVFSKCNVSLIYLSTFFSFLVLHRALPATASKLSSSGHLQGDARSSSK